MAELQRARGGPWQGGHHPQVAWSDLLFRAEHRWGGPLPGVVKGIQTDPLRCEMTGYPPERFLAACGIEAGDPLLCRYWQLYVEGRRRAAVYHNALHLVPLPALPAGVTISTATTSVKTDFAYDDARPLGPIRLYIVEARPGTVRAAWPDLAPAGEADKWCYYGIDYDRETLAVAAINLYRIYPQFAPPAVRRIVDRLGRAGHPHA